MKRTSLSLLLLIMSWTLCSGQSSPSLQRYSGQYIMRLGQRNLIVLSLQQKGAALEGFLKRPRAFNGSTYIRVTNAATATYTVQSASLVEGHVKLVVQNTEKAHDLDTWDLVLLDATHASLSSDIEGFADEPFPLLRIPVQPPQSVSSDWNPNHSYGPDEGAISSGAMARIFEEDQRPRQNAQITKQQWVAISKADEVRREQVRELLRSGELHTGEDFERAAVIFQHGSTSDDYLLAHTLAMVSVNRGDQGAIWIATATLDRYLQSIGRSQIYGTQYQDKPATGWTQEPYNRDLVSDALRRSLEVPSRSVQSKQLEIYKQTNH